MKMFLNEFKELSMEELLSVNGGYTNTSSSSHSKVPAGYSPTTGWYSDADQNKAAMSHSKVPEGYSPTTGWLPGWGPDGNHRLKEKDSGNKADEIDRTNFPYVEEGLSSIGYKLLSEENTNGYTVDSERNYYQEIFKSLKNNPEFNTFTREITIEGSPSAGFGHENVTEYIISSNGNIQLRVIDVNNDGKVDYVYKD